jgi:hypothetical protein
MIVIILAIFIDLQMALVWWGFVQDICMGFRICMARVWGEEVVRFFFFLFLVQKGYLLYVCMCSIGASFWGGSGSSVLGKHRL